MVFQAIHWSVETYLAGSLKSVDWEMLSVEGPVLSWVSSLLGILGTFLGNFGPVSVLLEVQAVFDSSLVVLNGSNSDAVVVDKTYCDERKLGNFVARSPE